MARPFSGPSGLGPTHPGPAERRSALDFLGAACWDILTAAETGGWMKKVFGYVLFVLGLMFVFLSPFLLFYTTPRVEKAPTDIDQTVVSDGDGQYFSAQRLNLIGPVTLEAIERFKGDPQKSTDDVSVINYQNHVVASDTGGDIDFDKEVYAMNRESGEAVNCCGEEPKHSGLELKFPFHTEQKTYELWDAASNDSYPAKFAGVEQINGVEVYRFHQETGDLQTGFIDIPGTLVNRPAGNIEADRMYNASIDAWVEPTTGAIVKGRKFVNQWAAVDGQKLLKLADLTLTYNERTVDKLLTDAEDGAKQLTLVSKTLPIVLPIIGIILAGLGLFLLRPAKEGPRAVPADGSKTAKGGRRAEPATAGATVKSATTSTSKSPKADSKSEAESASKSEAVSSADTEPAEPVQPAKPAEA
jgi:hypothetical protein